VAFTLCNLFVAVAFWEGNPPEDFTIDTSPLPVETTILIWPVRVQQEEWPPVQRVSPSTFDALENWDTRSRRPG
jgi:hypothetical protein